MVKRSRMVLAFAMAIYVASFFVSALGRAHGGRVSPRIVGYECASMTLLSPWTADALKSFPENPLLFVAFVLSGWINLVFLVAIGFLLKKGITRATTMLRAALLLMYDAGMLDRFLSRTRDAWTGILSLDWRHGDSDILNIARALESSADRAGFFRLTANDRNFAR